MIAWQEAVDRAIVAVEEAERVAVNRDYPRAHAYAQISYAWSNIGMMVEAQETAEVEAGIRDAVT